MNKQFYRLVLITIFLLNCHSASSSAGEPSAEEQIQALRRQLARQQAQIEELQTALADQSKIVERLAQTVAARGAEPDRAAAVVPAQTVVKAKDLPRKTEGSPKEIAGFQLSGDFRYRLDIQARSGNPIAPPLQNVRSRYRVRINFDRELDQQFRFHFQLATAPYSNAITNDQDMAGIITKDPFSIAEAYVDFHPHSNLSLRGGRMEEVFADNMRFLWDDDVRFNGFHQIVKVPLGANSLGLSSIELRAGEYILSNPAVYVLSPSSPFVNAGYEPGHKVRDSNLFHPGVIVRGRLGSGWDQQLMAGVELYRNPNQIQLASTPSGVPVLVNSALGLVLASPLGGTGNATTQPGGAMYTAPNFHIVHMAYRLDRKAFRIGGREFPAWLDFQAARNVGARQLGDAFMASANLGAVRQAGDVRALYQFTLKDANSMISQFTDDDLGTGSGVNIAVHALRFDVGLTRFLQLQNLFFIQHQRRASSPAEQLFVPLQRGANPTFRYLGQLAFSF